jgi:hypothetical protein
MKNIVLTVDYEIFFGNESGSVQKCMIEPSKRLLSILETNNSKMTVFWDILHFQRLIELSDSNEICRIDAQNIKKQVQEFAKNGHDVQFHIHSHWLDAQFTDKKWHFKYDRYKLHSLRDEDSSEDSNTIIGCLTKAKSLLEETIREVKPEYVVTTFRAGGFLIEPFSKLKSAFLKLGVSIDSSVLPGTVYCGSGFNSYDHLDFPNGSFYRFEDSPSSVDQNGSFIEMPIKTIVLNPLRNIYYKILFKTKYKNLQADIPGKSINCAILSKCRLHEKIFKLIKPAREQFTTDSNFGEKIRFFFHKAPDDSTLIMHPKLLNEHIINVLESLLANSEIKFISICDLLSRKKI